MSAALAAAAVWTARFARFRSSPAVVLAGLAVGLALISPWLNILKAAAWAWSMGSPWAIYALTCARIATFSALVLVIRALFAISSPYRIYSYCNLKGGRVPVYKAPNHIKQLVQRAVNVNLDRPLAQRAAYKEVDGKKVEGTGMRTARRIVNDQVDEEQLRLMSAWFARHGDSPLEAKARMKSNSKAAIAWALWGGSAGRIWVNATLREIDRKK